MKYVLLIFTAAMIMCTSCSTPEQKSEKSFEIEKLGYTVGPCTWEEWQKTAAWSDYEASDYKPTAPKLLNIIVNDEVSFILISAAWCPDCAEEVPRIYKLFKEAGISEDKIALYGVDTYKNEPSGTARKYNIERVPTLIVLKNGEEVGRIIEHPEKNWTESITDALVDETQVIEIKE
ncbi:MAG: thioredoxin family protein [Candidatus Kapabacteria bacterium]|jgi:thiol-disulfide isomerase/thioredoxin|nr:thioredoxin family protein [Candidatus Kapabacteria bacterium]